MILDLTCQLRVWCACVLAVVVASGFLPQARAVSANDRLTDHPQPDGASVRLRKGGDEWYHWHETGDGYTVVQDRDGFWKYARSRPDTMELEAIPAAVVNRAQPASLGLRTRQLPSRAQMREHLRRLRADPPRSRPALEKAAVSGGAIPLATRRLKCLVVLAAFDDHWDPDRKTVLAGQGHSKAEYELLLNFNSYQMDSVVGSVRDFYLENSYGQLEIDFIVTDWVQLPQDEAYYGNNVNEKAGEQRARQMALDAIGAADTAGVNFASADGNNDGWVDLLHIIHSGHGEEIPDNPGNAIWSHQWWLKGDAAIVDGVRASTYSTSPALRGSPADDPGICRIGPICHELGHQLGLPDLYDTAGETAGVGTWCCMGQGAWGARPGGDARQPVQFSAYCKMLLGFLAPTVMHGTNTATLARAGDHPEAHLIRDGSPVENEFFLLENRQPYGFDSQLPGGILIWHVAADIPGNDSSDYEHPAVRLEEANGGDRLASNGYASAVQTWTARNTLPDGFHDQTGIAECNAMVYQAGRFYSRTNRVESRTRIRISNFSASQEVMTYDLQTVIPAIRNETTTPFTHVTSWAPAPDATRYELQAGDPSTATSFADDAEDAGRFAENWVSVGLARRSSGGASSGKYSYMLAARDEDNEDYLPLSQALQLRASFTVGPDTALTFHAATGVPAGRGFLTPQISKDGGVTWITLESIAGEAFAFARKTYNRSILAARGIHSGDVCQLRFLAKMHERESGSAFPNWGFAIDDIQLTGIQMPSAGNWVTVTDDEAGLSRTFASPPGRRVAYRVRAQVGGVWQPYSPVTISLPGASPYDLWALRLPEGLRAPTSDPDGDGIVNVVEHALGRNGGNAFGDDGPAQRPVADLAGAGGARHLGLVLSLPSPAPTDITYEVIAVDVVDQSRAIIATKTGAGAWEGPAEVIVLGGCCGRQTVRVGDVARFSSATRRQRMMWLQIRR